jgi:hypothetical protein
MPSVFLLLFQCSLCRMWDERSEDEMASDGTKEFGHGSPVEESRVNERRPEGRRTYSPPTISRLKIDTLVRGPGGSKPDSLGVSGQPS